MTGIDMLLKTVFRLAGIDLEMMVAQYMPLIQHYQPLALKAVENMVEAQDDIKTIKLHLTQIDDKLAAIMQHLGVDTPLQEKDAVEEGVTAPVLRIANGD